MFTGIVQEIGAVTRLARSRGVLELSVQAPGLAARLRPMESVAVNGVCLTVVAARTPELVFELIPETRSLTTLGGLRRGDAVNLEPSLTLADRLNGHVVLGHVDGVGRISRRREARGERMLDIRVDRHLAAWLVPKGPVALDGVSLTVGSRVTASGFTVHLIPETLRRTTLQERRAGDRVNLEVDYLAKLVRGDKMLVALPT